MRGNRRSCEWSPAVAEQVLVKEQLGAERIAAADQITRRLRDDPEFELIASLWLYTTESNKWKLVVATPIVDSSGPIHAYQMIQGIIGDDAPSHLYVPLYSISVIRSHHSLVEALRALIGHYEIQELPAGPRAKQKRNMLFCAHSRPLLPRHRPGLGGRSPHGGSHC
jgi:hypothetical protein